MTLQSTVFIIARAPTSLPASMPVCGVFRPVKAKARDRQTRSISHNCPVWMQARNTMLPQPIHPPMMRCIGYK